MTGWLLVGYGGRGSSGRSIAGNSPDGPPGRRSAGPYFPRSLAADIPRRARRNYVSFLRNLTHIRWLLANCPVTS